MKILKQEKKLLKLVYMFCLLLFAYLSFIQGSFDKIALGLGVGLCLIIGIAHFIIRRFYPDGDKFIFVFASVLSVVSVAMLYRIDFISDTYYSIKQIIWISLGIIAFLFIVIVIPDVKRIAKWKNVFLVVTLILMPMALIFGKSVNGSTNWVYIGSFGFQPSEFAKITLILYLASALSEYEKKDKFIDDIKELLRPGLVAVFSLGCLILQVDLGSALIFFGISMTLLYVSTSNKKYVIVSLALLAVASVVAYFLFSHFRYRVQVWLNPWDYASGSGYQIVQGLYGISSGGLLGSGLNQGYISYIPVNESDFIFAAICEEFGSIFGIGLMIIYFLLFFRGIRAAYVTKDKFSQLVVVGFSTMIACQTLVIIGGIFAVIPLTGITLPILSYGGTSVLTIFFALGILQKISEEA